MRQATYRATIVAVGLGLAGIFSLGVRADAQEHHPAAPPHEVKAAHAAAPAAKPNPSGSLVKALEDSLVQMTVKSLTGDMARLLAEYKGAILSGNSPRALSDNSAPMLSGNKPKILSENDTSVLSKNRASLFSNIKVEINITINSNSDRPAPAPATHVPARGRTPGPTK